MTFPPLCVLEASAVKLEAGQAPGPHPNSGDLCPGLLPVLMVSPPPTARSCQENTSGTKAYPSQSASTHPRASASRRTPRWRTTTSSSSPTPSQVLAALGWWWGRGARDRGACVRQRLGSTHRGQREAERRAGAVRNRGDLGLCTGESPPALQHPSSRPFSCPGSALTSPGRGP